MEGQAAGDDAAAELEFYTGEFGTQLLDALKARLASGDYGQMLAELISEAAAPGKPKQGNPGMAGMPGMPAMGPGGPGMIGGPGMMPGGPGGPAGNAEEEKEEEGRTIGQLAPAITWVGTRESKDALLSDAQAAEADVLITFEIAVKAATGSAFINNTTRVRVSALRKDKEELVFTSAALNNRAVHLDREKGNKDVDPVEREVTRFVETLDKTYTTAELPAAVTPDRALARIQALVAEQPENGLPVVVEARYYVAKGLLKEEDLVAASMQVLGEEKYAEMMQALPGAGAGKAMAGAVSFGGLVDLMRGVNSAADSVTDPAPTGGPKPPGGGLGGLIPFGLPFGGSGGASGPAPGLPAGPYDPRATAPMGGVGTAPMPGQSPPPTPPGGAPSPLPGAVGTAPMSEQSPPPSPPGGAPSPLPGR
jgi:hypothetical protein